VRADWVGDRDQARLAWILFAGVALSMSQQLGLAIACATVSDTPGSVTQYAYAYYMIGVLLNLSVLPLSIVTLPDLVDQVRTGAPDAARRYMLTIGPYVAFLLVPALVAFVAFSEPLLGLVFDSGLGTTGVETMYATASTLALAMVAISVFTLGAAIVAAQRRWTLAAAVAAGSVGLYAVALTALGGDPERVAIGHVLGAASSTAILLVGIFGRDMPNVIGELARRCLPAIPLALPLVGLRLLIGDDPSPAEAALGAAAGLGIYVVFAVLLWRSVGGRLVTLLWQPVVRWRRERAA
jgi:peptidoglycan biosynthesis protein MviN/MurJ (putative lipid II flippase)